MQQLLEVISAFESAYRSGDGAAAAAAAEFEAVLAAAVDPLVEMCERSAEALKSGAPSRCALRCLHLLSSHGYSPSGRRHFHHSSVCRARVLTSAAEPWMSPCRA